MRSFASLIGTLALAGSAAAQQPAPVATPSPADAPTPRAVRYKVSHSDDDGDRAALGIGTQATGKRDTIGLLVNMVRTGSPAEKAGITEGDRLASINGTSLKVAAADAGEPEMAEVMSNRLVRQLRAVKAGDEVTLVVVSGGSTKTVKVKTVAMEELSESRHRAGDRAALGIDFGGGTVRDSLGLFVSGVVAGSPAEKAGIEEGNRIAAANGVDLRVPAAEAGEGSLTWAKQSRLTRLLATLKPGDVVELKVYANGSYRTVKVTTGKASDVFGEHGGMMRHFGMEMPEWGMRGPMPPMPPMAPMPPMPPMGNMHFKIDTDGGDDGDRTITCVSSGGSHVVCNGSPEAEMGDHMGRSVQRVRIAHAPHGYASSSASSDGDAEFGFPGLQLTSVSADLAAYFGAGSEKGLLVLKASDEWAPVKSGDIVLSHNGRDVKRDGGSYLSIESGEDNSFVVLRKGKKVTLKVKAH